MTTAQPPYPTASATDPAPTAPPVGLPTGARPAPPPLSAPAGGVPQQPPRMPRPDPIGASGYWPVGPGEPPAPAEEEPAPITPVRPTPGWGWRALVAFLAGGLLTAGGFSAALVVRENQNGAGGSATGAATASTAPARTATPAPPADAGVDAAAYVARVLAPSVVQIEVGSGAGSGVGSGVIYQDGLIMTNNHVIEGATQIVVTLADGRRLPAKLVGANANADIAVVSVDKGLGLTPATLATGQKAAVGQLVVAIGSPFKLQQTVTQGIVSAVDRPVPSRSGGYNAMIQTDAPINPGNSGGALADRQGRVIGINTAIRTDGNSDTNAGIGFALPIDFALSVANRLASGQPVESGLLGVRGQLPTSGAAGVEVAEVTPGSAAETAGVKVGDLITSIDGAPVTRFEELAGLVVAHAPGDVVQLQISRNGQPVVVKVPLGRR